MSELLIHVTRHQFAPEQSSNNKIAKFTCFKTVKVVLHTRHMEELPFFFLAGISFPVSKDRANTRSGYDVIKEPGKVRERDALIVI